MHIFPDLVRLEAKYGGLLVVLGIHSPKFPHEADSDAIRKAILRYHIEHPVVNDSKLAIWNRYGVNQWPTFVLIDPEGNFYGKIGGEGNYKVLDFHIGKLVKEYQNKGILKKTPMRFTLEREKIKSPLFFPGKVLADAKANRLFIADSSNNRIVITDLMGKKVAVAGTGKEGMQNGAFNEATFADPQGLAFDGKSTLYVADRKNHSIRALNLKTKMVKTVAGTGQQDPKSVFRTRPGRATQIGLNSPWDLLLHNNILYIAMAGNHQIWVMNVKSGQLGRFAGSGDENLKDGPLARCALAQPSGLGTNGKTLYIADSESSAIRSVALNGQTWVNTIVGTGLFKFGDVNGTGKNVLLQHPLAVQWWKGKLYVADTYNSKIKLIDPVQRTCTTFLGEKRGTLNEPSGLSFAGNKLYIADTGAHRIRVVDMANKSVTTLQLQGVPSVAFKTGEAVQSQR